MTKLSSIRVYGTDFPEGASIDFDAQGLDLREHQEDLLTHLRNSAEKFAIAHAQKICIKTEVSRNREALLDFITVVLLTFAVGDTSEASGPYQPQVPEQVSAEIYTSGMGDRSVNFTFECEWPSFEKRLAIYELAKAWGPNLLRPYMPDPAYTSDPSLKNLLTVSVPIEEGVLTHNFFGPFDLLLDKKEI
jgi:hypothetical protein